MRHCNMRLNLDELYKQIDIWTRNSYRNKDFTAISDFSFKSYLL